MLSKQLIASVKLHEGFRSRTYTDSVGIPTIGYGTNLLELEVTPEQAEVWMREDLELAKDTLRKDFRYTSIHSRVRRDVLTEMAYNLGITRLYRFKRMWSAIEQWDWEEAADEALDSKWARQVGRRATTLARRLRTGQW